MDPSIRWGDRNFGITRRSASQDVHKALLFWYDYSSSTKMFALGLAGAAVATLRLLLLSLYVWRLVSRYRAKWAYHLLFITCALMIAWGGTSLLFFAPAPIGFEPLGYALMAAHLLLALTLLVHGAALVAGISSELSRRTGPG